jgi:hypothetical protein
MLAVPNWLETLRVEREDPELARDRIRREIIAYHAANSERRRRPGILPALLCVAKVEHAS